MSQGISVRRGQAADLAAVLEMDRATAEAPHWSEDAYHAMLAETSLEAAGSGVRRVLYVAVADKMCGFAVASVVMDGAELESIVVLPEYRRRGVATALMNGLMSWAVGQVWRLEVRERNVAARELYLALGFSECGRRRAYYRDPLEDAVLMQKAT